MRSRPFFRRVAFAWVAAGALGLAPLPPDPKLTLTNQSLTILTNDGRIISSAIVCPGYQFDQLGVAGPRLSPDQHWVLVDILGPFAPGNVVRNHAIVQVRTGRYVISPQFKRYLGAPVTLRPLHWASGRLATLGYEDGTSADLHDPPRVPFPAVACAPPTPR